ncbi:hypothetical protein T12_3816 [Trichinella patagoniensis]|uniref:FLYWCH-type domain-containing protein n=1 Tax=Trichinella patagoniensis TaxID=990121 RepID=A0A0V0Z401_9BILA|nr:hypothetical protein T12_3816 [Trichinella patagoniensis]
MADDSDLRLVRNRRGGMSLVHEGRAYKLKRAGRQKYWRCSKQLRGEKVSVLSYICHNSGGQLLKRRQSEMRLTARLFGLRLSCTVRGIAQPSRFSNYFSMIWVARRGVRSRKR